MLTPPAALSPKSTEFPPEMAEEHSHIVGCGGNSLQQRGTDKYLGTEGSNGDI